MVETELTPAEWDTIEWALCYALSNDEPNPEVSDLLNKLRCLNLI